MSENYSISSYPLSSGFKKDLNPQFEGNFTFLELTKLRMSSLPKMVWYLLNVKGDNLIISLEDSSAYGVLPILQMLSFITMVKCIWVVDADMNKKRFYRLSIFSIIIKFIYTSWLSQRSLKRSNEELSTLLKLERIPIRQNGNGECLYLNANLWFGIKAGGSVGHISGVANGLMDKGYRLTFSSVGGHLLVDDRAEFLDLEPPKSFGIPFEANYFRFGHMASDQILNEYKTYSDTKFIYQRYSVANYSGVQISREFNIPLIVEYNGSEVWIARNWGKPLRYDRLAEMAEEVTLKHAHLIVTISNVLRDELIDRGVDPKRIVTYPNCMEPAVFDPAQFTNDELLKLRQTYSLIEETKIATFIGTFGQWHGVDFLARTILMLCRDQREWLIENKLHFLLIGDGLKMPEVQSILSDPCCDGFYTLTGLIPQLEAPKHLAISDILLSPHINNSDGSKFFGSPTKLFEYMAMGKPIIASDLDQISEVLTNSLRKPFDMTESEVSDQLALLINSGDEEGFISAIKYIIENPNAGIKVGSNARQESLNKYTWGHHVEAILDKFESLSIKIE